MANINNAPDALKKRTYDAIVVGSGVSGGWAAKELTEKGLKVLMLERGKPLEHITGYESANKAPWELEHRGRITAEQRHTHPFLARDYPYGERNEKYWFRDADAPYAENMRFDWFRPDIVGGKSIMWGRQSYRLSPLDFEANAKDGIAIDWPIRYDDLKPWYDYVEAHAGISGENLGLDHFPDGNLLPAMDLNVVEQHVRKSIEQNFPGRHLTIGRAANLTRPHKGRSNCQYRNLCDRGCPFSAYFSTQSSTLPPAMATKRLTLRPNSIVNSIIYDPKKGKASGVLVIDSQTNEQMEFHAKIIFVCASAIGSSWLLQNSISPSFPNGLGNSSGVLGHYLMDHHFRTGANGVWEGDEDKYIFGRRPNGIYVPRYRNVGSDKRDYLRGFGYQGGASREGWSRLIAEMGFGADMKNVITEPGRWTMGLGGFGECLPYEDNWVKLNPDVKDKWGQPTLKFNVEFKENEMKMREDMRNDAAEMLENAGLKNVKTYDSGSYPGMAIHEMGTARMGRDVKTSILNEWNQVHECKNVFVTDGACMTSASNVNPSLTYMALTARAADYAVKELKKKNL
ncbi:MAG: GMC family oxidoreductase [Lewinellaceae bacterium]|nr:GMC family oxidoreductase [Lewinellaceae bacterium]